MNARRPLYGPSAVMLAVVIVCAAIQSAPAAALTERPRGLIFRCRLVATDHGDDIALSFRLRTNESRGHWRIRMFHEGERIVSKARATSAAGDLNVRRSVPDKRGRDDVIGRARHLATGAVCEVASRV